jgi:prepilin-type processing-associated H-X9-DG protein
LLPQLEQTALYNSINHSTTILGFENSTCHSVTIGVLACPSDPDAGYPRAAFSKPSATLGEGRSFIAAFTSYAGVYGSLYVNAIPRPSTQCAVPAELRNQANGVFHDLGSTRPQSIKDGTGQTTIVLEHATMALRSLTDVDPLIFQEYGWYYTGNWGDTLVTTMYPPNLHRRGTMPTSGIIYGPSSMHSGGLNALFADGSVRFVKDTVDSWPMDAGFRRPLGASRVPEGWWIDLPRPGVWQALATRSGGETISAEAW